MARALIETKFFVPSASEQLVRPRLLRLLDTILLPRYRLALISAPAGYGKTTVVSQWIEKLRNSDPIQTRVAWISVDQHDNDPVRFWTYLTAALMRALSQAVPGFCQNIFQILQSFEAGQGQAGLQPLLESLVNELASLDGRLVIVLDDLNLLADLSVFESLAFLIEHLPPSVALMICTRSDPPLPLARLRARGQLVEVRMADLRFTPEEVIGFMQGVLGLVLRPDQAGALENRTEGWAAGLQMAGLVLHSELPVGGNQDLKLVKMDSRFDALINGFSGTHTFVLDYLAEEVLQRQPEAVQRFLLYTSILDRFCAPLCAALISGDLNFGPASTADEASFAADAILSDLERANLFLIPLDAGRQWWRYHHLFADLLQARLRRRHPALLPELHARAAAWCEQNGFVNQAVHHALAGRQDVLASRLVKKYWQPTANQGDVGQTLEWLRALPDPLVRSDPYLCVAFCWILWLRGQPVELEARLDDALRALAEKPEIPELERDMTEASIPLLQSILQRYQGAYSGALESVHLALRAIDRLHVPVQTILRGVALYQAAEALRLSRDLPAAAQAYNDALPALQSGGVAVAVSGAFVNLVKIYQVQGNLRKASAICHQAIEYVNNQPNPRQPAFGPIYHIFADVLREQNRLDDADAYLTRSMEIGRLSGHMPMITEGSAILARLRLAQGDQKGAEAAVQEVIQAVQKISVQSTRAVAMALQARLWIATGALDRAQNWAECAGLTLPGSDIAAVGMESEWITYARLLLAVGRASDALPLLDRSLLAAQSHGRAGVALEIYVVRALALERAGRLEAAQDDLLRALAWAYEQGYRRIFLDEGRHLAGLLPAVQARAAGPLKRFIQGLLADLRLEEKPDTPIPVEDADVAPSENLPEPLTTREQEVLRLLVDGLSNRDIARQLFVTEGTAKTHVHNLIAKLGVQNRTQAIARARELKLL